MPKSKYAKKRWRLTPEGKKKLLDALSDLDVCLTNKMSIARTLGLDRKIVASILDNTWQGNKKTIEDAFSNVGLDLEHEDCEEVIDDNISQSYTTKSDKIYEITQKQTKRN